MPTTTARIHIGKPLVGSGNSKSRAKTTMQRKKKNIMTTAPTIASPMVPNLRANNQIDQPTTPHANPIPEMPRRKSGISHREMSAEGCWTMYATILAGTLMTVAARRVTVPHSPQCHQVRRLIIITLYKHVSENLIVVLYSDTEDFGIELPTRPEQSTQAGSFQAKRFSWKQARRASTRVAVGETHGNVERQFACTPEGCNRR